MNDSLNIVQLIPINRNTRVALRGDQFQQLLDRRVDVDRHNLHSRCHHFARDLIAEVYDGLDHLAFITLENSLFLTGVDECLDFILGSLLFLDWLHLFFPPVEIVQCGHERPRKRPQREMSNFKDRKQS
jgi:hypothetical protein